MTGSLGRSALRGSVLMGLAQAGKMAVTMASIVILARLLAPEDFGLVAAISPLVAFVGLFRNLGLQQALVQRKSVEATHLNQAFWISLWVGLAASLIVALAAPLVGAFYGDPRLVPLVRVASLSLVLGSLTTVPIALLSRRFAFGVIAAQELAMALGSLGLAIAGALAGLDAMALVLGTVGAAAAGLAMVWAFAPYVPGRPVLAVDGALMRFGANLTGFNLVNFFSRNADNVLIGRFAGMAALGSYDRAYKLLLFPIQNINQPLSQIMIPILSRVQDEPARLRRIYLEVNWTLALLILPGIAAAGMQSEALIALLFGPQWAPTAPIFAWLALASFVQPVTATNGWLFIAKGRTDWMLRLGLYSSLVTVAAFVIGLRWGAEGVAAAYAISAYVLRVPVLLAVLDRLGPVRGRDVGLILGVLGVAAVAGALAVPPVLEAAGRPGAFATLLLAACVHYAVALAVVAAVPTSRRTLLGLAQRIRHAAADLSLRRRPPAQAPSTP